MTLVVTSLDAARKSCARPWVESLEDRNLLAPVVSLDLGTGILTINAPKQGLQVTVNAAGPEVLVALGGKGGSGTEVFDASLIHEIVFHGGRGNDTFVNNTAVPSMAKAGSGNDLLQAGDGPDTLIGGSGKDTLIVVPGLTTVQPGSKSNKVVTRDPDPVNLPFTVGDPFTTGVPFVSNTVAPVIVPPVPPAPPVSTPPAGPSDLAAQVLAFAESHLGTQVGDGQCGTLAMQALQSAGAKTAVDLGPTGPTDNYVWGSLVLEEVGTAGGGQAAAGSFGAVQPGDVVQFSNANFVLNTPTYHSLQSFPHHTAIIESYLGNGKFSVLQQNINGNLTVQRGTIDFSQLTTGTVWVYQPVSKS
jgi:Ca2+-binding RTX toxin-like protein